MTEAPNHAERGHAQWSASATARNVHCAGAIALSTLAGEEVESLHAARGTACHEISERALTSGNDPSLWLGSTVKTKGHEIEIDEEIIEGASEYVEYVRDRISREGVKWWVEESFSLEALDPPLEAGGTGDAVIYDPSARELEIVDLKFGRGVVNVEGNAQLRTYGLCALLAFPELDVEKIRVTIDQPRAPVKGETIRSEVFYAAELIDWAHNLLNAMQRSKDALDEFEQIGGSRTVFDEWAAKWLKPGACKFCPSEGICPALRKQALATAGEAAVAWFEDPNTVEKPKLNQPALLSPDERGHILDGLEMLEDWIKAVRASEHTRAERGDPATGYMLADKIGNRAWIEEDEKKLEAILRSAFQVGPDMVYAQKIKSPAQIEKMVGAKRKAEVDALCHKPLKGSNLVAISKTTRPPAKSKPEAFFEKMEK